MTNEEKTMRTMHGKVMLVPELDEFLTAVKKVADAIGMNQNEFMIVINLEMLRSTLMVAKEAGFELDLDAACESLKREVYGDDE